MSAAESDESRWPDFATASIRTQSRRRTVAQRSSSVIEGCASTRSASFGGGLGSGTGLRWVTAARLPAAAIPVPSLWADLDGTVRADSRRKRLGGPRLESAARPTKAGKPDRFYYVPRQ